MTKPYLLVVLATACASQTSPAAHTNPSTRPAPTTAAPAAETAPTTLRVVADPTLTRHLEAERLGGVIALLEAGSDTVRCSDVADCERRSAPASTFKIVNAMIALEVGTAPDAELTIPWDGVRRSITEWNRDHTLRSAFAVSSLPYFQELARRNGLSRMREYVTRFDYGDMEVGDVVDTFWLAEPLEISPVEQIGFLRRFETGALPISARTRDVMRDIMIRETRDGAELRGKTGWTLEGPLGERGWFVGYATRGGRTTYVAVRATRASDVPDAQFKTGRMAAAIRALESVGAY